MAGVAGLLIAGFFLLLVGCAEPWVTVTAIEPLTAAAAGYEALLPPAAAESVPRRLDDGLSYEEEGKAAAGVAGWTVLGGDDTPLALGEVAAARGSAQPNVKRDVGGTRGGDAVDVSLCQASACDDVTTMTAPSYTAPP